MRDIDSSFNKDLFHAYVIEGGIEVKDKLLQYIESIGMDIVGNPDVHVREYDSFGIDDGRNIQSIESKKAFSGNRKIFILCINSITREAQNSLLKTFEEPKDGTHFFVLIPSSNVLLDTLLSRVRVIKIEEAEDFSTSLIFARQFLSASAGERMALISEIIESKDKKEALSLVNSLERELYLQNNFQKKISDSEKIPTESFEAIQSVRSYLNDRSPSVKILLEHLSFTLPHTK
jgi:DNA polymerase III delta prime subunit